ncbi:Hsp70 family protein [uncultured Methanobrevibacter sp.]|uniref:Hsp70 family protein n=1 Tax=uncultured Methanobrevibacter sp. TaxID=253161 RepID=UPI002634A0DC|nr:Hsp70 family protein [uncultured Methanobrevibacter sp.]
MDFDKVKRMVEEFFNGQYEVKKFLGEGSFAEVYLVKHNFLDDFRAMKIIKEPLSATSNTKSVFREVMLATHLRHENIISIFDAGIITTYGDGFSLRNDDGDEKRDIAFFVMEYVAGGNLEQYLNSFVKSNLSMPISRALDIIKQILSGLNTLHSANPPIVHRDLKLNNILLSYNYNGEIIIKISDFGFAKEVTTGISDFEIAGTRPYMAPECFSKISTTQTDIYAVGVIFYQLLTNRYPYDVNGYDVEDLFDLKPWKDGFKPPSHINDLITPDLDEIVMKCLDADSSKRYSDACEMLADVEMAIDRFKSAESMDVNEDHVEEYSEYVLNDSVKDAFNLAKCENRLEDAVEILEREVLKDYDVRKCYGETLQMWKSQRPDIELVSKAFTVNLKGENYDIASYLLREAIAYNPSIKNKYRPYLELWTIFIALSASKNLIRAVMELEELMETNKHINEMYSGIIHTLKTYSVEEIAAEAVRLVNANRLIDGANLMEFAVVGDASIRKKYAYAMSLWKQNMTLHFRNDEETCRNTIDYAIDLGTTDSLISYFNDGNPIIIKNYKTGDDFTPSAVFIDEDDNVHVGNQARDALVEDSENAVSGFKHDMGFPVPFTFENASRTMLPQELSAEILKDLRISAYEQLGVKIEHAVICVPADSNPIKTKAVNEAADIAGFRSHALLLEPVAVAFAYGLEKCENSKGIWMIYDLGGGTFHVSLIGNNDGEIEKIATAESDDLGGNTFDWQVIEEILAPKIIDDLNLEDFTRINPKYRKIFAKLKAKTENAKMELSSANTSDIFIANLFEGYDFTYSLNRFEFKKIIEPYIETTFALARNLMDENSLSEVDIDKIILAGGSCLSPLVKDLISSEFDIPLEDSLNPLTVVAKGAAVYAGSLEKPKMDFNPGEFSVIINYRDYGYSGRAFNLDDKFSFLGYHIEFVNVNDGESFKTPIGIDGSFRLIMPHGEYEINIYDGQNMVGLDDKSPSVIKNEDIFIPYFTKTFSSFICETDLDGLLYKYVNLVKAMDYLDDYGFLCKIDIMDYIERLLEISRRDRNAYPQTLIYLDYLEAIVDDATSDLEFQRLLENVEGKISIADEKGMFDTHEYKGKLEKIADSKNSGELEGIYADLIEKYVVLNEENVITDIFFNLRYDGIYTTNKQLSEEFIKEGFTALHNLDYERLFDIIEKLCEIDERDYFE